MKHGKVDKMKKYLVESRTDCNEIFDNYYGDYIFASDAVTAVEIYESCTEIEWYDVKVTDVETSVSDIY